MSTLISSKPKLESDIEKILKKAAYEAFYAMHEKVDGPPEIKKAMDRQLKDSARRFADKFAEETARPLSEAIYNFTKNIGITMKPSGALISTSITTPSPVIGICPMSDFTIL